MTVMSYLLRRRLERYLPALLAGCGACGGSGLTRKSVLEEVETPQGTRRGGPVEEIPCPVCGEARAWWGRQ